LFSFATPVVLNFLPNFSAVGRAEEVSLIKRGPKTDEVGGSKISAGTIYPTQHHQVDVFILPNFYKN
jgi:hypothetical protein